VMRRDEWCIFSISLVILTFELVGQGCNSFLVITM
jgi:hypothetical protein